MPIWEAEIVQSFWGRRWHVYAKMSGGNVWVATFMAHWMAQDFVEKVYNVRA